MLENQNIEYKESWRDEYLKPICAFANSQGGILSIGISDNGDVVGVADIKSLLENLPNKIKNILGVSVEVNLKKIKSKNVIDIITNVSSVAISYHGKYYIRSGSTTKELSGPSLNDFLLHKTGRTWDAEIEERASINDIDEKSILKYLNDSENSNRLPISEKLSIFELLEKLRLTNSDKIKRGAIVLFGKDPGKFYPNISVKIGRFGKDAADLKFQEVEEGNLLHLLEEVPNQLNRKFFTKPIDFEGLQRIEKNEYPVAAIREMLLNALVHKNYSGATIQIRIYDNKISFWNEGTLPEGLSFESLKRQHPSRPRNPIIADVCFKGGYIDAWGRGTLKIIDSCKEAGLPEPQMQELDGGFLITIFKDNLNEEQLNKLGLNDRQIKAVLYVKDNGKITNKIYRTLFTLSDEGARNDLNDLVSKKILISKGSGRSTHYVLKTLGN